MAFVASPVWHLRVLRFSKCSHVRGQETLVDQCVRLLLPVCPDVRPAGRSACREWGEKLEGRRVGSAAAPGMNERVHSFSRKDISGKFREISCVSSLASFSDWVDLFGRDLDAFRWDSRLIWECDK